MEDKDLIQIVKQNGEKLTNWTVVDDFIADFEIEPNPECTAKERMPAMDIYWAYLKWHKATQTTRSKPIARRRFFALFREYFEGHNSAGRKTYYIKAEDIRLEKGSEEWWKMRRHLRKERFYEGEEGRKRVKPGRPKKEKKNKKKSSKIPSTET